MLQWFAETTLVASALAALAAVACRWGRLGPGARHALWVVVLVKLVTPPLFRLPLPAGVPGLGGPTAEVAAVARPAEPAHCVVAPPEPPAAIVFEAATALPAWAAGPSPVASAFAFEEAPEAAIWPAPASAPDALVTFTPPADPPASATVPATPAPGPAPWSFDAESVGSWLLAAWGLGALGWMLVDLARVATFADRIRFGAPAPEWVEEELIELAGRLGVRVPAVSVVAGVGTPMLWCLGRPRLILPPELLKGLGREAWRGVLAHELAHVRRGDPWVGRLALVAGWLWWWNPLFWLVKSRLEAEAELACDAWVLWALPGARRSYAEALVDVCARIAATVAPVPSPSWGVGGAGRFFERRLTMILKSKPLPTPPRAASLAAALLALAALPSWAPAQDDRKPRDDDRPAAGRRDGDDESAVEKRTIEVRVRQDDEDRPADAKPVRVRVQRRDRAADGDDDAKDGPEARERREAIEKELKAAQERMQDAQKRMHERMQEAQKRMQEELRGAQEEMQAASRELAELQAKLAKEIPGDVMIFRGPDGDDVAPFVVSGRALPRSGAAAAVRFFPQPPAVAAPPAPPASNPDLERRVGELEKKFDLILEELRGLRRDRDGDR